MQTILRSSAALLVAAGLVGLLDQGCAPSTIGDAGRRDGGGGADMAAGGGDGGSIDFGTDDSSVATTHDPATCAEAASLRSYIGCDYWPTVVANAVWNVFDYAVVISNPGSSMAQVTITGGALSSPRTVQVAPGQLTKVGLPWVSDLKGPEGSSDGNAQLIFNSTFSTKGAYHLVSDVPVLVYQFSPLEYQPGSGNNLRGEPWSDCPAQGIPCFSYSNDASLLLPSTAMTKNYVVSGVPGPDRIFNGTIVPTASGYMVVTATQDNTTVAIQLSAKADILASPDGKIAAVGQNPSAPAKVTYAMNAGDVIQLISIAGSTRDYTGSILQATAPVQVVVGTACTANPISSNTMPYSCDHLEESVLPIETWGKRYGVTSPTGPYGIKVGHTVRLYGGIAAATLTYAPAVPGAPATIAPGQVVAFDTDVDFVVGGDHEFAVSGMQRSAQVVDPLVTKGDPSLSFFAAVEQYRDKYLFLAPTDYDINFVDVVVPDGVTLMLDGAAVTTAPSPIGAGYGVLRLPLAATNAGAHTLTGAKPFGIQVIGYGSYTSYQYPGGLDLKVISQAPPPIL